MSIKYNEEFKIFNLQTKNTSYIMQVAKKGYLTHVYWGKKIETPLRENMCVRKPFAGFTPAPDLEDKTYTLDSMPLEYPSYGTSDFRYPAFQVELEDGSSVCDVRYVGYKIEKGKPSLEGLPSVYIENENEAQTLKIELFDEVSGLKVYLIYTVIEEYDVITRAVKFINTKGTSVKLLRALSANVDFNDNDFDLLYLPGAWAREREVRRTPVGQNINVVESKRGASSHQMNPFIALLRPNADEFQGEVYGFSFVYSGNFIAQTEVNQYMYTRVSMGINPYDFSWLLDKDDSFTTPEVVMVYSDEGLNKMSQTYHKLYRERLCRGTFRDKERPVLINNWEATYFDFNEEKLEKIASTAAKLGVELFVLDDGWFGKRNSDNCSLGDWYVNKEKLPNGLEGIANKINSKGMKFGLWVEPEMISPDSDLYRQHPDWCIHVKNRSRSEGRNQLILDLSREDVCEYLINTLSKVFSSANISYVKWDMNRHMTEVGSDLLPPERQRETAHRYILGLYKVSDRLTKDFPHILFESCSGGGGRFDPGMLYYMPQTWTSDNTDAAERLFIQYGTSLVYPQSSMGAHVSIVPNHQVGRITSLKTRGDVAMSANLGYELDLNELTDEEKEEVREQIKWYKGVRQLVQYGTFYRLLSPFVGNHTAWIIISEDKKEFIFYYYKILNKPNMREIMVKLKGINKDIIYVDQTTGEEYKGDELSYRGIKIPNQKGDFSSKVYHFKAK